MAKCTIEEAIELLNLGKIVALPTETVYGLAAKYDHEEAVDLIYQTKQRSKKNPLILHVANLQSAMEFAHFNPQALKLAQKFWPGPLTLILKRRDGLFKNSLASSVCSGLSTIAIRVPAHPMFLTLLKAVGPLVAPSANPSTRPSPTCAQHVLDDYDNQIPVIDGGCCSWGMESTILGYINHQWSLLRSGSIALSSLAKELNIEPQTLIHESKDRSFHSPGTSFRHYCPKAKVTLATTRHCQSQDGVIGFSSRSYPSKHILYLADEASPFDLQSAYYNALRRADKEGLESIWVDNQLPLKWFEGVRVDELRDCDARALLDRMHRSSQNH